MSIRSTPPSRRSSIVGAIAVPRIVEEQRAFAADRLELVVVRQRGAAMEDREHVAGKAKRPGEHPVGARRAEPGFAEGVLRLAAEEARAGDVVTADVHQRAALESVRRRMLSWS